MTEFPKTEPAVQLKKAHSRARLIGQICIGIIVGFLLLPALLELASLVGDITPFKYQGF